MRVAIFCRVSTRDRGQDTANQLLQLQQFCKRQDWTVVQVYKEEASGRKGERDRETLRQVFVDARKHKWDCLLFWSLDRLTRQGAFATLKYLSRLSELGIGYKSYTEEYLNTMGVFGDVIISLLATLAKQEAVRVSERTKAGLERARAQGRVGGRPRAKVTAEQVRRLHEAGKSLTAIAGQLHIGKSTAHRLLRGVSPETSKNPSKTEKLHSGGHDEPSTGRNGRGCRGMARCPPGLRTLLDRDTEPVRSLRQVVAGLPPLPQ